MLRKFIVTILILVCFILQTTLFRGLSFAGIAPNLMIILTSSFGFIRGENEGMVVGFFAGLLSDIFFGDILGFYALIYMYIGYVNGKFSRIFYPEDIKLPLGLIVISDLSYGLIIYILLFLLRGRFDFFYYLKSIILPEVIYTIIITIVLYPIILLINERMESKEKRSAKKFV